MYVYAYMYVCRYADMYLYIYIYMWRRSISPWFWLKALGLDRVAVSFPFVVHGTDSCERSHFLIALREQSSCTDTWPFFELLCDCTLVAFALIVQ